MFECGAVPDGFVSGAVCFVRRTLARSVFLGFQIGIQRCKKCVNLVDLSRQELSNEYVLARFVVDTTENVPLKVCQKLAKS